LSAALGGRKKANGERKENIVSLSETVLRQEASGSGVIHKKKERRDREGKKGHTGEAG